MKLSVPRGFTVESRHVRVSVVTSILLMLLLSAFHSEMAEGEPLSAAKTRATTKHAKARPTRARHDAATPGAAALRVALDPETKRATRPSPESIRAAQVPASTFRPYVEYQADGSALAHLGDHFMSYSVVRYDSAGVAHHFCVEGAAAATRALKSPVPARPARTEE